MTEEKRVSAYQQAILDATIDAVMQGNGFIKVSLINNQFDVKRIDPAEYKDHAELMTWITENKHTSQQT